MSSKKSVVRNIVPPKGHLADELSEIESLKEEKKSVDPIYPWWHNTEFPSYFSSSIDKALSDELKRKSKTITDEDSAFPGDSLEEPLLYRNVSIGIDTAGLDTANVPPKAEYSFTAKDGKIRLKPSAGKSTISQPDIYDRFGELRRGMIVKTPNAKGNSYIFYEIMEYTGGDTAIAAEMDSGGLTRIDLRLFSPSDQFEISLYREKANKSSKSEIKIEAPYIKYMEADFSAPKNQEINTYRSLVKQGIYNGEEFISYNKSKEYTENTTFLKKANEDILLYIPLDWANYAGYNEDFIKDYIDALNGFEISNIKYLGKSTYESFGKITSTSRENYLKTNEFYLVHISGENEVMNFMIFTLLSYLYDTYHNNLPGLFMQLRKKLEKQCLSDWQVLLYTHIFSKNDNHIFTSVYTRLRGDVEYAALLNIFSAYNSLDRIKNFTSTPLYIDMVMLVVNSKKFINDIGQKVDYKNVEKQFLNYKSLIF